MAGWTSDAARTVAAVRRIRRNGFLHRHVAVSFDATDACVRVRCGAGRICRPLFVLPRLLAHRACVARMTWPELLRRGVVEFLDALEEHGADVFIMESSAPLEAATTDDAREALARHYTHAEISAALMLGFAASLLPYIAHNAAPRNAFASVQIEQAMQAERFPPFFALQQNRLVYGQKPLVGTRAMQLLGMASKSIGEHAVIAVFPHSEGEEDGLVWNRSSLERGLMLCSIDRRHACTVQPGETLGVSARDDHPVRMQQDADYSHLDEDGIARRGAFVREGDVLFAKHLKPKGCADGVLVDSSVTLQNALGGQVTSRLQAGSAHKVVVSTLHQPEVGDKFSTRQAQKGVISCIESPEDMIFEEATGMVPDAVFSVMGFSRQTEAFVWEALTGRAACEDPAFPGTHDTTYVRPETLQDRMHRMERVLKAAGCTSQGASFYVDGRTGRRMKVRVFTGLVYYLRLKHLVAFKCHSRAKGPTQSISRQPPRGRGRKGGMRVGEMEREALASHGAMMTMLERAHKCSDDSLQYFCARCGFRGMANRELRIKWCWHCETGAHIHELNLGYSTGVFLQEQMSEGVAPRLLIETVHE